MAFEPDIVVADPHGIVSLVVETKLSSSGLDEVASQLARYMFGMRCPMGMLVTPERVRLYRDTYSEPSEHGVERIAEFDSPLSVTNRMPPSGEKPDQAARFEHAVQSWLESLGMGVGLEELGAEARRAVEDNVLPLLRTGQVRAGHPRWRRTGT